jgi:hypothetical protein
MLESLYGIIRQTENTIIICRTATNHLTHHTAFDLDDKDWSRGEHHSVMWLGKGLDAVLKPRGRPRPSKQVAPLVDSLPSSWE